MKHFPFWRPILLLVILAAMWRWPHPAVAQPASNPAAIQAARDKAEADEAVNGWWTEALKSRDRRLVWWREARFGCFIHWGVYADPAGEFEGKRSASYSEHIM